MIGVRKDNPDSLIPKPGEYGRDITGAWFGCTPNDIGANLSGHTVVEHEDGTVTVSPSILCGDFIDPATGMRDPVREAKALAEDRAWHGFLERGVWRSC